MSSDTNTPSFANMRQEQLPIPRHKLHGWTHFVGLYAAEHVAATEFVIGATFVALGASTMDIVVGLLIGNVLAILSWTLITAPIAVDTRLSLFTYLHKMGGDTMTNPYNWANVLIFTVISAAMLTVSSAFAAFWRLGGAMFPRSGVRLFLGGFSVSIVSSVNQVINWRMCKKQQMGKEPIRTGAPAMETRSA